MSVLLVCSPLLWLGGSWGSWGGGWGGRGAFGVVSICVCVCACVFACSAFLFGVFGMEGGFGCFESLEVWASWSCLGLWVVSFFGMTVNLRVPFEVTMFTGIDVGLSSGGSPLMEIQRKPPFAGVPENRLWVVLILGEKNEPSGFLGLRLCIFSHETMLFGIDIDQPGLSWCVQLRVSFCESEPVQLAGGLSQIGFSWFPNFATIRSSVFAP